ncbi:hypothetical protein CTATCC11996_16135 [Comamonas testosteroni ATCC 11996]|nr:hypothetical protein CTATCC11996_16135 [Comamonas testosteroni ATCC 11996]
MLRLSKNHRKETVSRNFRLLCQAPRSGGGQDGLAEAFEQGGDAGEAVVQGIDTGQDGVEFVGDAALFTLRCQR